MRELPKGWAIGPLVNFITPRGEKVLPSAFPKLPFIGMDHVEAHTTRILGSIPAGKLKSSAVRFYTKDILYGRLRPYLNKVAQPNFDGLASAEFIIFSGNKLIDPAFLRYRLNARDFVSFAISLNAGDRPRVNFDQISDFEILVPPLNEQRRIVAKIEAMFDQIDKGVESLKTARATLGLYRQSLLKAAFEGRLTAEWRAQNAEKLEDADTLLSRIKAEREARYKAALKDWAEDVARWRADGQKGKRPVKPKRPNTSNALQHRQIELPELPYGWAWAPLGLCSLGPEYGTAAKSKDTGKVPVIRMGNLQRGRINWGKLAFTSDPNEIEQYMLKPGDVLFNRTNSPELVGKTSIYKGERPALFAGYLVRVNQIEEIVSGDYLNYFLNSTFASQHSTTVKTDGVNQSNINASKLQQYPFPFCSPAEQVEIVRLLDARLDAADTLEAEIDAALTRAETLRQSILKKAFAGRLVPQDPNDEPASVLMQRIHAEQTKPPKTLRKTRRSA